MSDLFHLIMVDRPLCGSPEGRLAWFPRNVTCDACLRLIAAEEAVAS